MTLKEFKKAKQKKFAYSLQIKKLHKNYGTVT